MTDPFIKTYDAFDAEFCNKVIENFKFNKELGCTARRNDGVRKDHQQDNNPTQVNNPRPDDSELTENQWNEMDMRNSGISTEFFNKVNKCIQKYSKDLGLQNIVSDTYLKNMLVQGYEADSFESYSTWHCEAGNLEQSDRAFVFMLYLNDDFEGGETEFMFQKHKEKPKQGKLVIWPAGYTHVHRGAMLMSGEKYIATGWTFFISGQ